MGAGLQRAVPRSGRGRLVRGRRAGVRRRPQRHHRGRRAPPDAGGAGRRQHPRAGQQGVADHRRPGGHQPREARPDRAGRLRALGPRAVPARRLRRGGTPPRPHRERRPVPRAYGGRPGRRHGRGGAGPPDLGHGSGRHHQLRDAGQQGPGGHRGAPAVRDPLRPHRGRGAPDERGALDGRVRRRLDARAGQPADHADPDRARPGVARPGARHRARRSTGPAPRPGSSSRSTTRRSRRCRSRGRRERPAAPRPPSTTPPTRWPSRPSGPDAWSSAGSCPRSPTCLRAHDVPSGEQLTVDDVLAADAWARNEATRLVGS